jgi:hypothetical protein
MLEVNNRIIAITISSANRPSTNGTFFSSPGLTLSVALEQAQI